MNTEIALNDSTLVQKSDPLRQMKDIPFTLTELKLLDTYLSCININDESSCTLRFSKSDYKEMMGLEAADWRSITKSVSDLMKLRVKLYVKEDGHDIYKEFSLFESVEYDQDNNDSNNSVVTLTCSKTAQDFFYCLHKYHYTKYELSSIISLTSRYSYLLYLHINAEYQKKNHNHCEWDVPIDKLRNDIFDLEKQKSYKDFATFNRSVLEVAVKEINEKTNYMVKYERVKRGKNITAIHFSCFIKDSDKKNEMGTYDPNIYKNKNLRALAEICGYTFSNSQMKEIETILEDTIIPDFFGETEDVKQKEYLKDMYRQLLRVELKLKNSKRAVKNRFLYFKKMLVCEMDDFTVAAFDENDERNIGTGSWSMPEGDDI